MRYWVVILILIAVSLEANASDLMCYASQTTIKPPEATAPSSETSTPPSEPTPAPSSESPVLAAAPPEALSQSTEPVMATVEIPLEKSYLIDAQVEVMQFTSPDYKEKNLLISASLNTSGTDVTLLLRDLKTGAASGFTGALGQDASVVANLATTLNGEQKLISLTCHAAVAAGNLQPHSPQNF